MTARWLAAPLLLALQTLVRADTPPAEHLLPASTQIYLRWDGVDAHRDRYRQVTIGRLLESDLAPLLKTLLDYYPKTLQSEYVDQKLLDGSPPSRLARFQADVAQAGKLPEILARHGIIIAGEIGPMPSLWSMAIGAVKQATGKVDAANPLMPTIRVTVIVPDAAKDAAVIESIVRLQIANQGGEAKEETIAGRRVVTAQIGELKLLMWDDFGHVVVALGTETPQAIVTRTNTQDARLAANPLFQRIGGFREFPTDIRGFVDLRAMMKTGRQALNLASLFAGGIAKKVDEFGPDSFQSLVYYCGFDGQTRREVAELDLAKERSGIAKLLGGRALRWEEMPPLPLDVGKWSAHRLNLGDAYALFTRYLDIVTPREPGDDNEPVAAVYDKAAGIALKEELFDQLGDLVVTWSSPSEGAVMLGQALAIRVRDGARVESALDQIVQAQSPSYNIKLKKRPCLDAAIREIQVQNKPGFIILPSYVVYKDWLVIGLYPQPLQAFVQRAAGNGKVWQPDSDVQEKFGRLPKDCSTWAFNDLRPGAQQLLAFAPLILEASQSFMQTSTFEVGVLPTGSTIIQKLAPNVTGVSDNGNRLRWDARGGLLFPGDSLGIDPMMLFIAS